MKYIKSSLIALFIGLFFMACETEMIDKLDDFNLEKGGYMRTVTPFPVNNTTFTVRKTNMGGTRMEQVLEAVTPNKGALFSSYDLEIRYVGASSATAFTPLRSIPASAYAADPQTGYPRHTLILTGTEALAATKLDTASIANGRWFEVRGTMKLTDGRSFNASNTGVNITGGAFYSSPFLYRINIAN